MADLSPEGLVATLGEPESNLWLFQRAAEKFQPDELAKILEEARSVNEKGGELTADRSRKRTFGGIFLRALKTLDPARMAPILAEQMQRRRKENLASMREATEAAGHDTVCPGELLGKFIGKKGAAVARLRKDATEVGCKIMIDESGRIRAEGPPDEVGKVRTAIQEKVSTLILETHQGYHEQVLLSEWMTEGHNGQHVEKWANTLYSWITVTIEHTPASKMESTFERFAAATPQQIRQEILSHLINDPDFIGSRKVRQVIINVINAVESSSVRLDAETSTAPSLTEVDLGDIDGGSMSEATPTRPVPTPGTHDAAGPPRGVWATGPPRDARSPKGKGSPSGKAAQLARPPPAPVPPVPASPESSPGEC